MLYMTCASLYAQCFMQYALLLAFGGKVKQCNGRAFLICFFVVCCISYASVYALVLCILLSRAGGY